MKNQLITEKQLDQIKEIRELMNEKLLFIRTKGAFFNGKEIVIETMGVACSAYETIIIIDANDFKEYHDLKSEVGYCFESPAARNLLEAYIDVVGKFTVQKEMTLLDDVVNGFKDMFKFGS